MNVGLRGDRNKNHDRQVVLTCSRGSRDEQNHTAWTSNTMKMLFETL